MHRLQELAEQSKAQSPIQSIDWDWVISTFGPTRTRLVKLYFLRGKLAEINVVFH